MPFFKHVWQVYELLPMKAVSRLPDEGFGDRPIVLRDDLPPFQVMCLPPRGGRHRLMVTCICNRMIPLGRMGQHWKVHR